MRLREPEKSFSNPVKVVRGCGGNIPNEARLRRVKLRPKRACPPLADSNPSPSASFRVMTTVYVLEGTTGKRYVGIAISL
jgi:hypothetical protein